MYGYFGASMYQCMIVLHMTEKCTVKPTYTILTISRMYLCSNYNSVVLLFYNHINTSRHLLLEHNLLSFNQNILEVYYTGDSLYLYSVDGY